jgi:hypothetical protein
MTTNPLDRNEATDRGEGKRKNAPRRPLPIPGQHGNRLNVLR